MRRAAARVARRAGIDSNWLNDGVQGFMSVQGNFATFLELDHLKVMMAEPAYLLASFAHRYILLHVDLGDDFPFRENHLMPRKR